MTIILSLIAFFLSILALMIAIGASKEAELNMKRIEHLTQIVARIKWPHGCMAIVQDHPPYILISGPPESFGPNDQGGRRK